MVYFTSKINLPSVNPQTGRVRPAPRARGPATATAGGSRAFGLPWTARAFRQVEPSKLAVLSAWRRNYTLETVLAELRRCVHRSQPAAIGAERAPHMLTVVLAELPRASPVQGDGRAAEPQAAATAGGRDLLSCTGAMIHLLHI